MASQSKNKTKKSGQDTTAKTRSGKDQVAALDFTSRVAGTSAKLVELLTKEGHTIATCESLTAGLCAAKIADTPGASKVLRGGLVTYQTDTKNLLAGVPVPLLDDPGPVSKECAVSMAQGVRKLTGADYGLALTGVAGPEPQGGHPVGEVWIALATPTDHTVIQADARGFSAKNKKAKKASEEDVKLLAGSRRDIREEAVKQALELVVATL